jgi:hypothetical protein
MVAALIGPPAAENDALTVKPAGVVDVLVSSPGRTPREMGHRQELWQKAGCAGASPIRRTRRSARVSLRSPKSAVASSACRRASPMWSGRGHKRSPC